MKCRESPISVLTLESYSEAGATKYAAVMIRNSGVDKTDWWFWRIERFRAAIRSAVATW